MRTILIVLDSVGIGELPDADKYGDVGSNTLINIKKAVPTMSLPNLISLGLSNINGASLLSEHLVKTTMGSYGKIAEASAGKDTTIGHWEISGVLVENPLPTYPNGFPSDLVEIFSNKIGKEVIGNCVASGTEILNSLGSQHVRTGAVILYTSADSVFQIAAHENIIPIDELYKICEIARELLIGENAVSRVIARPFIGSAGNYTRTRNRKDFSLKPPSKTMLDYLKEDGQTVHAIGKIEDIFAGIGITSAVHTINNMDGVDKTLQSMNTIDNGLIFTNLVDFDMIYGHRNDYLGYANALEEFDKRLPEIIDNLRTDDLLIITADHGCDPTTKSTDHSREYIPLLVYGKNIKANINLGERKTFGDIAATILEYQKVIGKINGTSFLDLILK